MSDHPEIFIGLNCITLCIYRTSSPLLYQGYHQFYPVYQIVPPQFPSAKKPSIPIPKPNITNPPTQPSPLLTPYPAPSTIPSPFPPFPSPSSTPFFRLTSGAPPNSLSLAAFAFAALIPSNFLCCTLISLFASGGRLAGAAAPSAGGLSAAGTVPRALVGVLMSRPTASRRRVFCSEAGPLVGWSRARRMVVISLTGSDEARLVKGCTHGFNG